MTMGNCMSGDGRPSQDDIMAANMATLRQRDMDLEREAAIAIAREKTALRKKAMPSLENHISTDFINIDSAFDDLPGAGSLTVSTKIRATEELMSVGADERAGVESSLRISKREKRQKAKIDADVDQKWMIFRDLDAFDEADMVKVARFMETVLKVSSQLPAKRSDGGGDTTESVKIKDAEEKQQQAVRKASLHELEGQEPESGKSEGDFDARQSQAAQDRLRLDSSEGIVGRGSESQTTVGAPSPSRSSISLDRSMSTGNIDVSKISLEMGGSKLMNSSAKDDTSARTKPKHSSGKEKSRNVSTDGSGSPPRKNSLINTEDLAASSRLDALLRSDVVITPTTALNVRNRSPSMDSRDGSMDGSNHGGHTMRSGRTALEEGHGRDGGDHMTDGQERFDLQNFDLPPGFVTRSVAKSIIDVYKQGGRLSMKAVHKLLRLCYRAFKTLGNTSEVDIAAGERMTIVGDIHGQLSDLMYILDHSGLPSKSNKYIFNGDFVDRGPNGVEVMCVMMALYLGNPGQVCMNRGNHEDFAICCVYGFQQECCTKYDEVTFGMFVEVFNWLPLFAMINRHIFVLHGGLFHNKDVTLRELDAIKRTDFSLKDLPESGETLDNAPRDHKEEFYKQLQRDALWSDPSLEDGLAVSNRGAGVMFGPDIARNFCDLNGIRMIVRSHECCRSGFELPYVNSIDSSSKDLVATIFSASNYGGGGNSAAYMVFTTKGDGGTSPHSGQTDSPHTSSAGSPLSEAKYGAATVTSHSTQIVPVSGTALQYEVHYFAIDSQEEEIYDTISKLADQMDEGDDSSINSAISGVSLTSDLSIHELILRKKALLLKAFELADFRNNGYVTISTWADCMHNVLSLSIDWVVMASVLVDDDCMVPADSLPSFTPPSPSSHDKRGSGAVTVINYRRFLETFSLSMEATDSELRSGESGSSAVSGDGGEGAGGEGGKKSVTGKLVDSLYAHHNELLAVFRFFDVKKDNVISKEEFREGCRIIRQLNTAEQGGGASPTKEGGEDSQFDRECDMLLEIMNLNGSGYIDINDFLEMFRVSDAMQKKLGQYEPAGGGAEGRESVGSLPSAKVGVRRASYSAQSEPARRSSLKAVPPPALSIKGSTVHGD